MDKLKYYTPTIDEFHVGFEYEYFSKDAEWTKNTLGFNRIEPETYLISIFSENETKFRVKYLDKEDIESLGFIYKGTSDHNRLGIKKEMIPISGFSKNLGYGEFCHITCFLEEDNIVHSGSLRIECTDCFEDDDSSPFSGYREGGSGPSVDQVHIQNKSELVVLLKQLGV